MFSPKTPKFTRNEAAAEARSALAAIQATRDGVGLGLGSWLVGGQGLLVEPDVGPKGEQQGQGEGFTGGEVTEEMAARGRVPALGHGREALHVTANDAVFLGGHGGDLLKGRGARLDRTEKGSVADLLFDRRQIGSDLREECACLDASHWEARRAADVEIDVWLGWGGRGLSGGARHVHAHQDQTDRKDLDQSLELHGCLLSWLSSAKRYTTRVWPAVRIE
jgi:hypothetical protein